MLLESLARLDQQHAQYKGATTNTQRRQEEVLREIQDQVVELSIEILKTEEDSGGLKTRDLVGQIEARVPALEDRAKKTEGPKTSQAPVPPEGFVMPMSNPYLISSVTPRYASEFLPPIP